MAEPAGSPQAAESSSPFSSSLAALDPEFPPQSRRRSCTWPLPRPELVAVVEPEPGDAAASPEEPGGGGEASGGAAGAAAGSVPGGAGGPRKGGGAGSGGARRNAWGSQSYADLISQAIQSAPDKRLTLAQIYEWMVRSVPYFRDKGDSNSSAGWKNSIRHNLSLHNKFIKVHNEATGKSSWWMLNPEGGKSGKAPRRRAASMDNSSKLAKLHGKTHRKKPAVAAAPEPTAGDSPVSQFPKWPGSPSSRSNEDSEVWTSIRPRSSSNASSVGLSSVLAEQDDLADEELLPSLVFSSASSNVPPTVTEELELIDGLNLMSASPSSLLAAQQPGSSGAETRSPPFPLRAPSSAAQASGSFGSSLFSSLDHLLPGSTGHFSQSLEELLTANSPPVSDVMMTQVDPILPQSGSRVSSQSYLLLGDQPSKPKRGLGSLLRKPLEQPLGSVGATTLPSSAFTLPAAASSQGLSALKSPGSAPSAQLGPQPAALPTPFPAFDGNADKLPNDLDVDMYMEDLQCDVDYIISTDLMDGEGLDFNFEPLPPTSSYPSTSQASNHSWVPS